MNLKKAKKLRKQARELSVGMPERRITIKKVQAKNNPAFLVDQHHNDPKSTRGIYRQLKRATA